MSSKPRLSHVTVTVARDQLEPEAKAELLAFYRDVFGFEENEALARPGERIFLRAPDDDQYLTIRASDAPMQYSGYEHVGFVVETRDELMATHARARAFAQRDDRVEIREPKEAYGGALLVFRVRFLLPLSIEVQVFSPSAGGASGR